MNSFLLSSANLKAALLQAVRNSGMKVSLRKNTLELNLGAIPAVHFDMQFNQRLVQAFAQFLAREQASIGGLQEMHLLTPDTIEPQEWLDECHPGEKELFQRALDCLQPATLKSLLHNSPTDQLQLLLRLLLEGAWQSPKMLPVFWYGRVTASRLSIAAALYLLKSQQGHDWLISRHSPPASHLTGWAKAIARGEIPPEQVAQLLTGNRPSNSALPWQPAYPSLVVMRWLLPLWRQPAVRQVIHRLKGGRGVQQVDAYLSRCLQRQDDDALREDQRMHTDPQQVALSRDNATLLDCEEMSTPPRYMMQPREGCIRSPNEPLSSNLDISNAGLLLLWPLLPQLFSQLSLWEEEQFISDTARWQSVYCLDRLVWGEANPTDGRLTLNQVLCGVSLSTPVPPTSPLSVLQQQQIDDWLTAIGQQLAGWQKLSMTDIRQLFLQRTGKISTEGAFPQIIVKPEPYDFLLRDWPWLMTLASFPWTEQPLTIIWPLNGLTG